MADAQVMCPISVQNSENNLRMGATADLTSEDVEDLPSVETLVGDEDMEENCDMGRHKVTTLGEECSANGKNKEGSSSGTESTLKAVEDKTDEDEIVILDDNEDDNKSGASISKRRRTDDTDEAKMEVDEMNVLAKKDVEEKMGKFIRKMTRQDLEDLVLAKIVEAIVAHTEVGHLRAKVLEVQMQKDKMASKMGIMLKQVAELSSAINIIMENEARDPKNRNAKPHVIRFNRSVGLQTNIDPSVRTLPPKIIRVPEQIRQISNIISPTNGTFNVPNSQALKRPYPSNKSGNENRSATSFNQVSSTTSGSMSQATLNSSVAQPGMPQRSSLNISKKSNTQNSQPGLVDLTDDDTPPTATPTSNIPATTTPPSSNSQTTTIINGMQVQYPINRTTTTQGVQLVSPSQGQQKFIATQPRPVVAQPVARSQLGNQPGALRNTNQVRNTPYQQQRSVAIRPPVTSSGPNGQRVAVTIPSGVLGANSNVQQKRFTLPPLPVTPPHKVRFDSVRPPTRPELTLSEQRDGIVLSWNLPNTNGMAEVTTYQIFACQEHLSNTNRPAAQWKRVGDVKALPLPMACTLSQFTQGNKYYFIVRGIDLHGRVGPFCEPQNILLQIKKQ